MSSRSHLIQTNRTMIILDPEGMPINLGQTPREDSPEAAFPVLAYDGQNILPTALGYKSFFGNSNRFFFDDQGTLSGLLVQQVLMYQTVNYTNIFIALCEDGIYVNTVTQDSGGSNTWERILHTPATPGVRRQWTSCVIKNLLYVYQQGSDHFYGFVDPATYEETTIPEVIVGADILQHWTSTPWMVGVLKFKPNFINITAQIGIFKAGNRLGFWDSEGAVAWSSATQIYDFKPSTTTFAGITTFTDVIGTITIIKQHGSGFIIYASKSIVLCQAVNGSPEKWAGRAIFNEVGVLFDIQVAVGQPDTVHYAITSGGLCVINSGAPEILETEVMDYVKKNNKVYGLSFVDSRYLFIHCTDSLNIAVPEVGVQVPDSEGHYYTFPTPITPPTEGFVDLLDSFLGSTGPAAQEEFSSHDPLPGVYIDPGRALLPCWTGRGLVTTFQEDVLSRAPIRATVPIPSGVEPGVVWQAEVEYFKPRYTTHYFEDSDRFIDLAGEEFAKKLAEATDKLLAATDIAAQGLDKAVAMDLIDFEQRIEIYTGDVPTAGGSIVTSIVDVPSLSWVWQDLPIPVNLNGSEGNACSIELKSQLSDVEVNVQAIIQERKLYFPPTITLPQYPGQNILGYTVGCALIARSFNNPSSTDLHIPCIYGPNYPIFGVDFIMPLYKEHVEGLMEIFSHSEDNIFPEPYSHIRNIAIGRASDISEARRLKMGQLIGEPFGNFYYYGSRELTPQERAELEFLLKPQVSLVGVTLEATTLPVLRPTSTTIFTSEVSGFGYIPKGGFSFRKTHSRSLFKPCDSTRSPILTTPEELGEIGNVIINPLIPEAPNYEPNPPYEWDYPSTIPLPPNYMLLQKGTASPYYVTYKSALVLDTQLGKWGIYSDNHKLVYSLYPINRTDQTIVPMTNEGMLAGSLLEDGACTIFSANNPTSRITYGKIGDYRLGMSSYTKITAQFLGYPQCALVAEVSIEGAAAAPTLSQAINVQDTNFVTMPFTLTGKWLNIHLEGTFDLVQLTFESSATSRR